MSSSNDLSRIGTARRFRRLALAATLAVLPAACAPGLAGGVSSIPFPSFDRDTPRGIVSDHVVLVSIDGLRPDAIEAFQASTLQRVMREGRYTLQATTILPSKTLPSHTSMLTGEDVDEHGITWNTNQVDDHGHVDVPTVFGVARQRGFHTAAFFSKTKFEHLQTSGSLDYTQAPAAGRWSSLGVGGRWPAAKTVGDVERYLADRRPNLLFVHVGEPDFAGHVHGWMSTKYGAAVRAADAAVARIIAASDAAYGAGNWTLIVTADHGGHGRNHGSTDVRDITIPWLAWGKGVVPGAPLGPGIRTFDTAATVLWLLGLEEPSDWAGTPVTVAFEGRVRGDAVLAAGDR